MVGASRWLSILTTHAGNDAVMPCCGLVVDTFIPAVDELVRVDVNVIQQKSPLSGAAVLVLGVPITLTPIHHFRVVQLTT